MEEIMVDFRSTLEGNLAELIELNSWEWPNATDNPTMFIDSLIDFRRRQYLLNAEKNLIFSKAEKALFLSFLSKTGDEENSKIRAKQIIDSSREEFLGRFTKATMANDDIYRSVVFDNIEIVNSYFELRTDIAEEMDRFNEDLRTMEDGNVSMLLNGLSTQLSFVTGDGANFVGKYFLDGADKSIPHRHLIGLNKKFDAIVDRTRDIPSATVMESLTEDEKAVFKEVSKLTSYSGYYQYAPTLRAAPNSVSTLAGNSQREYAHIKRGLSMGIFDLMETDFDRYQDAKEYFLIVSKSGAAFLAPRDNGYGRIFEDVIKPAAGMQSNFYDGSFIQVDVLNDVSILEMLKAKEIHERELGNQENADIFKREFDILKGEYQRVSLEVLNNLHESELLRMLRKNLKQAFPKGLNRGGSFPNVTVDVPYVDEDGSLTERTKTLSYKDACELYVNLNREETVLNSLASSTKAMQALLEKSEKLASDGLEFPTEDIPEGYRERIAVNNEELTARRNNMIREYNISLGRRMSKPPMPYRLSKFLNEDLPAEFEKIDAVTTGKDGTQRHKLRRKLEFLKRNRDDMLSNRYITEECPYFVLEVDKIFSALPTEKSKEGFLLKQDIFDRDARDLLRGFGIQPKLIQGYVQRHANICSKGLLDESGIGIINSR